MGREGRIVPQKNDYSFEHIEKENSKLLDFSDTLDFVEEEKRNLIAFWTAFLFLLIIRPSKKLET